MEQNEKRKVPVFTPEELAEMRPEQVLELTSDPVKLKEWREKRERVRDARDLKIEI